MKRYPLSKGACALEAKPLVVAINAYDFGSTGMIAISALKTYEKMGYETLLVCDENRQVYPKEYFIGGSSLYRQANRLLCRIDGSDGFHNKRATKRLLSYLESKEIAAFHLHNIHSFYINLPLILDFAAKRGIPVIWTIHDCWAFTGRCSHFRECQKWKDSCGHCPNKSIYPRACFFDESQSLLDRKVALIKSLQDKLAIVCPSKWIYDELGQSRLGFAARVLIHNGVDFPQGRLNKTASDKIRLLFVASPFSERKGIRYVERLSSELPQERFEFHIVGDIHLNCSFGGSTHLYGRVSDRAELATLMGNCDVFVNPTLDENFPTTNLEALSAGLPIITFDAGGAAEAIDMDTGVSVPKGDYQALKEAILRFEKNSFSSDQCRQRASQFSEEKMNEGYAKLLKSMLEENV